MPFQKGHKINIGNNWNNGRIVPEDVKKKIRETMMSKDKDYDKITKTVKKANKTKENLREFKFKNFLKNGDRHCPTCKKPLVPGNSEYFSDFKKRKFCNNECKLKRSGKNSCNWQGGLSFEKYSIDWTETLRISIRERDRYTCRVCGNKQGDITHHVHHIDYNKENCNPTNLITLCISCHMKTNTSRNKWKTLLMKIINN